MLLLCLCLQIRFLVFPSPSTHPEPVSVPDVIPRLYFLLFLPWDCSSQPKSHSLSSVADGTGAPALNPESFRGSLQIPSSSHPQEQAPFVLWFISLLPSSLPVSFSHDPTVCQALCCTLGVCGNSDKHGPCPCESSV